MEILLQHRGKERAVDGRMLAAVAGLEGPDPRRLVRKAVSNLRRRYGVAIAANSLEPSGYYLAVTADELDEATSSLIRRGLKILSAAAKMKKMTLPEFMGQLRLEEFQNQENDDEGGDADDIC